jgi:hypothetical protein
MCVRMGNFRKDIHKKDTRVDWSRPWVSLLLSSCLGPGVLNGDQVGHCGLRVLSLAGWAVRLFKAHNQGLRDGSFVGSRVLEVF